MPSKEQLSAFALVESSADDSSNMAAADSAVVVATMQQHPAMRAETAAFLSQDMEQLVCEIKENLRLSGFKHRTSSSSRRLSRASPYPSVALSCACKEKCTCRRRRGAQAAASSEDPYERLQELLRDGSLIKEAVRRLKIGLSPKQRYYYDDSDESTTAEFPSKLAACDS
jgi:hypothetical protein